MCFPYLVVFPDRRVSSLLIYTCVNGCWVMFLCLLMLLFIRNSIFYVENDPGVNLVMRGTKVYLKYRLFGDGLKKTKGHKTCANIVLDSKFNRLVTLCAVSNP